MDTETFDAANKPTASVEDPVELRDGEYVNDSDELQSLDGWI